MIKDGGRRNEGYTLFLPIFVLVVLRFGVNETRWDKRKTRMPSAPGIIRRFLPRTKPPPNGRSKHGRHTTEKDKKRQEGPLEKGPLTQKKTRTANWGPYGAGTSPRLGVFSDDLKALKAGVDGEDQRMDDGFRVYPSVFRYVTEAVNAGSLEFYKTRCVEGAESRQDIGRSRRGDDQPRHFCDRQLQHVLHPPGAGTRANGFAKPPGFGVGIHLHAFRRGRHRRLPFSTVWTRGGDCELSGRSPRTRAGMA